MVAVKRMTRTPSADIPVSDINMAVKEYVETKTMADAIVGRANQMKAKLKSFVESHGHRDEKGHMWLDVEGVDGVGSIKVERRVSVAINYDKAEAWLKKNDMWEKCSKLVPAHRELDEDKLMAMGFENKIPRRVFDGFSETNETFAFKTVK